LVHPSAAGKPAWLTPKSHHVGLRRRLHIAWPKQRQHEVHGDWSVGELSRGGQLVGDPAAGAPIVPSPPASDTAAASSCLATAPIPA
jgi:hypothetical protein